MDYKKIYDSLIQTRRERGQIEGTYGEWHHIVARCMGGGDEPENLVWLTAREHYLAHLLLAYHYKTESLWRAVNAMSLKIEGRVIRNSRMIEVARKRVAEHMKDCAVHEVVFLKTLERRWMTRDELKEETCMDRRKVASVVIGRRCHEDVCSAEYFDKHIDEWDKREYNFLHIDSSAVVVSTIRALASETGLEGRLIKRMVKGGNNRIYGGFTLLGREYKGKRRGYKTYPFQDTSTGDILRLTRESARTIYPDADITGLLDNRIAESGGLRVPKLERGPLPDISIYSFILPDGNTWHGTRQDAVNEIGVPMTVMGDLLSGKKPSYKGIMLLRGTPEKVPLADITQSQDLLSESSQSEGQDQELPDLLQPA